MAILNDYFSKGLCSNYGDNRMPRQYSPDLRNVRIENKVTIPRKGYATAVEASGTPVRGIASNNGNLYVFHDAKMKKTDLTAGTYSDVASLFTDTEINTITYGKHTVILGDRGPMAYDGDKFTNSISYAFAGTVTDRVFTGTGLDNMVITGGNNQFATDLYEIKITVDTTPNSFQWRVNAGAWSSNIVIVAGSPNALGFNGISVTFATNSNHALNDIWTFTANPRARGPRFGAVFSNYTWVTGNDYYKNILYSSVPITAANQEKCYDWTGSGADQIVCKADIVGLASTLDRLFIFQKGLIGWIGRSSYATIGGVTAFFETPLAQNEEAVNNRCVVVAGDRILFLTARKKIKTVNYIQGIEQPEIGELSDDADVGITDFMNSLDDDQSEAFGYYDAGNRLVKFHVKSSGAQFNDTVIIWDFEAKTFLVDDSKFFSCGTVHDNKPYCGSCLNGSAFEDESGTDDAGAPISWYREGAPLCSDVHGTYKIWMGATTSGTIGSDTEIDKTIVIDGFEADSCQISRPSATLGASVGSHSVGSRVVGGGIVAQSRTDFVKDRTYGYVNLPGRYMQVNYFGHGTNQDFSLESLQTKEKKTSYVEPSNDF